MDTSEPRGSLPEEFELVTAARLGDTEAFAELYRRHRPAARATVAAFGVARCDRDDIVNQAFANILEAFRKGGGPADCFRPYLVVSIRNIVYNHVRRAARADDGCRRLHHEVERTVPTPTLTSTVADDEPEVRAAFAQLPERWRRILHIVDVEGRRPIDIADELGLSPNAVSALTGRARRGLRTAYLDEVERARC